MKTDRELLELAAKAYSDEVFEGWGGYGSDCERGKFYYLVGKNGGRREWNPLTDDGDALRLAVKLQLDFYVNGKQSGCWISDSVCLTEDIDGDTYAATRRAIVRAAAAIGEKL